MSVTTNFTDLELVVMWERIWDDALPDPFIFTCRTRFTDEYLRQKAEAWAAVRERVGTSFDSVLKRVGEPDIRIVVNGWDDNDFDNPQSRVRLHGIRRGGHEYLLGQLPGETIWHSGGYTVTELATGELAAAVAAALPAVGGGRRREIRLPVPDDEAAAAFAPGESSIFDPGIDSSAGQRFLETPTERVGTIEISQGRSKYGPRGLVTREYQWRDHRDDGRYVIAPDEPPIARSAGRQQLADLIDSEIQMILRRLDTHLDAEEFDRF